MFKLVGDFQYPKFHHCIKNEYQELLGYIFIFLSNVVLIGNYAQYLKLKKHFGSYIKFLIHEN